MKNGSTCVTELVCSIAIVPFLVMGTIAQTAPYLTVEKFAPNDDIVYPGSAVQVVITLTGRGDPPDRLPIDVVNVVDKSQSMAESPSGWNSDLDPPYGPQSPPYMDEAWIPMGQVVWAVWKFYEFLFLYPPIDGFRDCGGLVFFSDPDIPDGVPGVFAVTTPTPVQVGNPEPSWHETRQFWWFDHLSQQTSGEGSTAMGCGMQYALGLLDAMPPHPAPSQTPAVTGDRHMIVITDGRPGAFWTPAPEMTPSWSDPYSHCVEMARMASLCAPWGDYSQFFSTTIHSIGLGSAVESLLLQQIADPFDPVFWGGTPVPENVKHGEYYWLATTDDLTWVYQSIARSITGCVGGRDIQIVENWARANGLCADGNPLHVSIVPDSWNITPEINPGDPPVYTWRFDQVGLGDTAWITFMIRIDDDAPIGTSILMECPESHLIYTNSDGVEVEIPIPDPGIFIAAPPSTPTISPETTPTNPPPSSPTASIDPTPSSPPLRTGVRLDMPSHYFSPGSPCGLTAWITNTSDLMSGVRLFIILEFDNWYFFHPSWCLYPDECPGADSEMLPGVPAGVTEHVILPAFVWPEIEAESEGLRFYGAMIDEQRMELIGDMGFWEFGFGY